MHKYFFKHYIVCVLFFITLFNVSKTLSIVIKNKGILYFLFLFFGKILFFILYLYPLISKPRCQLAWAVFKAVFAKYPLYLYRYFVLKMATFLAIFRHLLCICPSSISLRSVKSLTHSQASLLLFNRVLLSQTLTTIYTILSLYQCCIYYFLYETDIKI